MHVLQRVCGRTHVRRPFALHVSVPIINSPFVYVDVFIYTGAALQESRQLGWS